MIKKTQYDILFEALSHGLSVTDACIHANISQQSYYKKFRRDKQFEKKVLEAALEFKRRNILLIQKSALDPTRWTAAAWLLERKYQDEFGTKQKLEHTGNVTLHFDKRYERL